MTGPENHRLPRPAFTRVMMIVAAALTVPLMGARSDGPITILNLRTREKLVVRAGRFPAPSVINRFLRCRSDRRYTLVDPRLIQRALVAARVFGMKEIEVISAFRTARMNSSMRARGHNVALRSRHVHGQALDLRIPGVPGARLCRYFRALRLGGVGCYPRLKFIHIDVGPVRTWNG